MYKTDLTAPDPDPLFSGDGEMAGLLRAKDWSATPLGPPATWDRSLRTVVRIMLTSRYAMWMGWGPELSFFYNDAYGPTLGAKHPWALGQPARQVWAEIWPAIGPRIDAVLQRGEATWDQGLLLFLERRGYPEETYHTFSYSPLPDDRGGIGGMFCVVTEETDRVLGERRLALLRDLASRLATTNATDEVFAAVEGCLASPSPDLPFSLTYLFEDDGRRVRRVSRTEIPADHPAAPEVIELDGPPARWPLSEVLADATEPVVAELDPGLVWPRGAWPRAPDRALLVPIAEPGQSRPAGVFIAGLNVHRPLDDAYRAFVRLFVGQLSAGFANAREVAKQASARRQAEIARANERELRRAAEQGSRAKDEFLAMLGHELRNPLAPIVTALHLMRLRGDDRTLKERTVIERQVSHLTRLVDDLMDVARITRGKIDLKTKVIELSEAVARALEMASPIVEQRQHQLTLDVPAVGLLLRADPVRLAQVIANLLTNAAKYTEGKGTIAVTAARQGDEIVLGVRDSGIGIAPEMLPRVFDLFAQEWQASDRSHGGLGLGLSIVRSLVTLHGGTVEARSDGLGRGSEFVVRLPALALEVRADGPAARPTATPGAAVARKILVVEDNEDVAETLTELLEHLGHVVRVAHDGPAALQIPDGFIPDLALLDIGLPVMDGYELARRVRERRELRHVALVALSGYGQETDRERSRQAGFVAHLVKPVDPDHLKRVIDELTAAEGTGSALS